MNLGIMPNFTANQANYRKNQRTFSQKASFGRGWDEMSDRAEDIRRIVRSNVDCDISDLARRIRSQ